MNRLLDDPRVASRILGQFLRTALRVAASAGSLECVNRLLLFPQISAEDLGWALEVAAEKGNLTCMNRLLDDPRFDPRILARFLGKALRVAANAGSLECMTRLLDDSELFSQISEQFLEWALMGAARKGSLECMNRLLDDSGVASLILAKGLVAALRVAAGAGSLECMTRLLSYPRLALQISAEDLGRALEAAALAGNLTCLNSLLSHPGVAHRILDGSTHKYIRSVFNLLDFETKEDIKLKIWMSLGSPRGVDIVEKLLDEDPLHPLVLPAILSVLRIPRAYFTSSINTLEKLEEIHRHKGLSEEFRFLQVMTLRPDESLEEDVLRDVLRKMFITLPLETQNRLSEKIYHLAGVWSINPTFGYDTFLEDPLASLAQYAAREVLGELL